MIDSSPDGVVNRLFLVFAGVLVAGPAVLFALGVRGSAVENRSPAPAPVLEVAELTEQEFYTGLDSYLVDRMPLRPSIVELDARLDLELWRTSPSDEVGLGADGWLFYRDSWQLICEPGADGEVVVDTLATAARIIEASGRDLLVVLVPNKATVQPEKLGPLARSAACADEPRRRMVSALDRELGAGFLDVLPVLEDARVDGEDLFLADDTHWKPTTGLLLVEALVDRLQPGVWDGDVIVGVDGTQVADLTAMIGLPRRSLRMEFRAEPPGATVERLDNNDHRGPQDWVVTGEATTVPGATVVLHDSFLGSSLEAFVPFLERSRLVLWRRANSLDQREPGWFASQIAESDRVVIELVERHLLGDAANGVPLPLDPGRLVAALEADLVAFRRAPEPDAEVITTTGPLPVVVVAGGPSPSWTQVIAPGESLRLDEVDLDPDQVQIRVYDLNAM